MKVRRLHSKSENEYPTVDYPDAGLLESAQTYCKEQGFPLPVDFIHNAETVYTLISANSISNVIGKFDIWQ